MVTKSKAAKSNTDGKNGKSKATPGAQPIKLIPETQVESAPDGFQPVLGERVVGWWAMVPGNVIQGILRDTFETKSRFKRDDGKATKTVYKIEVTKPGCQVMSATDDGAGELAVADVGDLVGVDEKGFISSLARVLVGQEVWIAYRGKEESSPEYPQGRHVFIGPLAKPATKVNPVTGEVTS